MRNVGQSRYWMAVRRRHQNLAAGATSQAPVTAGHGTSLRKGHRVSEGLSMTLDEYLPSQALLVQVRFY